MDAYSYLRCLILRKYDNSEIVCQNMQLIQNKSTYLILYQQKRNDIELNIDEGHVNEKIITRKHAQTNITVISYPV